MSYDLEKDMNSKTVIEMPRYLASELRGDILDLIEWSAEDGLEWWEIYGVISGLEKHVELVMKADLLMESKETPDEV